MRTVTGQHSGLRIARFAINVASLAQAWRIQLAQGSTPTATPIMNVSSSGSRNGGKSTPFPLKKNVPLHLKTRIDIK